MSSVSEGFDDGRGHGRGEVAARTPGVIQNLLAVGNQAAGDGRVEQLLQRREVLGVGLLLYGLLFFVIQLLVSAEPLSLATSVLFTLQTILLSTSVLWPRLSALMFVATQFALVLSGAQLGYFSFVGLAFVASLAAKQQTLVAVCVAAWILASLFLDPVTGMRDLPKVAVVLNALIYLTAVAVGAWIGRSLEKSRAVWKEGRARKAELQEVLHESVAAGLSAVAAGLSAVVARLQALVLRERLADPRLLKELEEIAELTRGASRDVRLLLESGTEHKAMVAPGPTPPVAQVLTAMKHQLEKSGFFIEYVASLRPDTGDIAQRSAIARIVRELETNVSKYGDRRHPVMIRATESDGDIRVEVVNEILEAESSDDSTGLGLQSMAQLAANAGGEYEFSRTGTRFRSALTVPKK